MWPTCGMQGTSLQGIWNRRVAILAVTRSTTPAPSPIAGMDWIAVFPDPTSHLERLTGL